MVVSILFRSSAISYYEAGLVVNVEDWWYGSFEEDRDAIPEAFEDSIKV